MYKLDKTVYWLCVPTTRVGCRHLAILVSFIPTCVWPVDDPRELRAAFLGRVCDFWVSRLCLPLVLYTVNCGISFNSMCRKWIYWVLDFKNVFILYSIHISSCTWNSRLKFIILQNLEGIYHCLQKPSIAFEKFDTIWTFAYKPIFFISLTFRKLLEFSLCLMLLDF